MCRYIESNSLSAPGQKTIFFRYKILLTRKIEKVEGGLTSLNLNKFVFQTSNKHEISDVYCLEKRRHFRAV